MPKDNEVDETPHWGDLMRELRSKVPEGLAPLVDRLSFACDQRLSFLLHERYEQDLSHAATVAELRAKADAAERRVAKLTGLLSDTAGNLRRMANDEFAECDQVRLEHVVNRIEDHLTGADPT